jgi:hypothetical protein
MNTKRDKTYLDINDFVWKIDEHSKDYIGELALNHHPKFQKTFTPKDLTLVIENKSTETVGYFSWFASLPDGLHCDHQYICHTLLEKGIILIPPHKHKIAVILRHL